MTSREEFELAQKLYIAYYGRPADEVGLSFWADKIEEKGASAVINDFGNSPELVERFGDLTNEALVSGIYEQAFNRAPDKEGLAFYIEKLNSGELNPTDIALTIVNNATNIDEPDADVLANKVAAADLYTESAGSRHAGIKADNYSANYLADINADTVLSDIDMENIVIAIPEPEPELELELELEPEEPSPRPEAPETPDTVEESPLKLGNPVFNISQSSVAKDGITSVTIGKEETNNFAAAQEELFNNSTSDFGHVIKLTNGSDVLEVGYIEFIGESDLRDAAMEVGYDGFIGFGFSNNSLVTPEMVGVSSDEFFNGESSIEDYFGYDWPFVDEGQPEVISRSDGQDFELDITLYDSLGIKDEEILYDLI